MTLVAVVLMLLAAPSVYAQPAQITIAQPAEATTMDPGRSTQVLTVNQIIHDDKPWLELFHEVIVYGVSRRVAFKPRADYRLIVAEMAPSR